jgi:hypothetical protein
MKNMIWIAFFIVVVGAKAAYCTYDVMSSASASEKINLKK